MRVLRLVFACVLLLSALCAGRSKPPYGGSKAVYNNPGVIVQFERAWEADEDGTWRNGLWEYGFRIDYVDGKIVVGELVVGDGDLHIIIPSTKQTIAIAHVHPIRAESQPSKIDLQATVPNYEITQDGLYVTNPKKHTYKFLKPFNQMFALAHSNIQAAATPSRQQSQH